MKCMRHAIHTHTHRVRVIIISNPHQQMNFPLVLIQFIRRLDSVVPPPKDARDAYLYDLFLSQPLNCMENRLRRIFV